MRSLLADVERREIAKAAYADEFREECARRVNQGVPIHAPHSV